MRSQTLLVILIVLVVLGRGAGAEVPAGSESAVGAQTPTVAVQTMIPVATLTPATATATTPAPPTSGPIGFESTPFPTATPPDGASVPSPTPTAANPSPTTEPEATQRPVPPETGISDSLIIERGPSDRREVAFTFDAGEGPGYTSEILDLLAQYGVPASFGVTGQWAEQNPDLLQRIVAEGHQIINHTYDHRSFTGDSTGAPSLTLAEREKEIEQTETIISDIAGGYVSMPYFRFPYGDYDRASLELLGELGYSYTIWWTCDTWAWLGYSPDQIFSRCEESSELGGPGAILLFHVAQDGDWEALDSLIRSYLDAGYDFVTTEEMIQP